MRAVLFAVAGVLLLPSLPPAALAQGAAPSGVRVGDRVRVRTRDLPTERMASIVALSPDSIEFRYERGYGDARLPLRSIESLLVSDGSRTTGEGARRGAGRGFVTGVVLGGALAAVTLVACGGRECFGAETYGLIAVPLVIGGTTAAGAVIGATVPGEKWRRVDLR
jgi:hypothetical protein